MISPNVGLRAVDVELAATALVCSCSACGWNGLRGADVGDLVLGVDRPASTRSPAPAKSSSGCSGGWIVHVFFSSAPVVGVEEDHRALEGVAVGLVAELGRAAGDADHQHAVEDHRAAVDVGAGLRVDRRRRPTRACRSPGRARRRRAHARVARRAALGLLRARGGDVDRAGLGRASPLRCTLRAACRCALDRLRTRWTLRRTALADAVELLTPPP